MQKVCFFQDIFQSSDFLTVQPAVVCSRPLCTYCGIFSPFFTFFQCNFSVWTHTACTAFQTAKNKPLLSYPSRCLRDSFEPRTKIFFNSHEPSFRKSPFCTFSCINPEFGGPWDMLWKIFLIAIFIMLQKNTFGQKKI